MAKLIRFHGPCRLKLKGGDPFTVLVQSIISQQLSIKAASTIESRIREYFPRKKKFHPEDLSGLGETTLRSCGLSSSKVKWILKLADASIAGELKPSSWSSLSDEEVVLSLTAHPGIGRWTAEMFLLFSLGRQDILALGDVGLQNGLMRAYGLKEKPSNGDWDHLSSPWKPWRSVASWYLWRAAHQS